MNSDIVKDFRETRVDTIQGFRATLVRDYSIDGARPKLSSVPSFPGFVEKMAQLALETEWPYLAVNIGGREIYDNIRFHYAFLGDVMTVYGFRLLLDDKTTIYSSCVNDTIYAVKFSIETTHSAEGELTLEFQVNNVSIYYMSFSIVGGFLFRF